MDSHKRSTQLERLEVVETDRRWRWSDDEKLRIVTESFQAPRAISSTARRHGISRSLLMTWRRSFGPEPISPQGEQSGFARVILAAEVEPAVVATPPSGQRDCRWPGSSACEAYQYSSWRAVRAVVDPSLDQLAGHLSISRSRLPAFAGSSVKL
jgi:transposase